LELLDWWTGIETLCYEAGIDAVFVRCVRRLCEDVRSSRLRFAEAFRQDQVMNGIQRGMQC